MSTYDPRRGQTGNVMLEATVRCPICALDVSIKGLDRGGRGTVFTQDQYGDVTITAPAPLTLGEHFKNVVHTDAQWRAAYFRDTRMKDKVVER